MADGRQPTRTQDPVFDPHAPDLSPERAYRLYERLRSDCPVSWGEAHGGYWAVSRYAEVREVALDHDRYSSTGGVYVPPVSDHRFPPIDYDPPEHAGFRQLIAPLTSGAAAKAMEPRIRAIVTGLVDAFADRGCAELVSELATPLPLHAITQLYGLEPEQTEEIRDYSLEFLEHASTPRGREVIDRVRAYWMALFDDRRDDRADGAPGFAHYVASKAAVDGLTRAAARELGADGITVNGVAPGLVSDEASRALNTDEYIAAAARGRALPREMAPDDLVGAVLFLTSDAGGFITGQTLVVDGGGVFT